MDAIEMALELYTKIRENIKFKSPNMLEEKLK